MCCMTDELATELQRMYPALVKAFGMSRLQQLAAIVFEQCDVCCESAVMLTAILAMGRAFNKGNCVALWENTLIVRPKRGSKLGATTRVLANTGDWEK